MKRVNQRVNTNQHNCGVNVKSSVGTSLALDFYGTIVTFVEAMDYSFFIANCQIKSRLFQFIYY